METKCGFGKIRDLLWYYSNTTIITTTKGVFMCEWEVKRHNESLVVEAEYYGYKDEFIEFKDKENKVLVCFPKESVESICRKDSVVNIKNVFDSFSQVGPFSTVQFLEDDLENYRNSFINLGYKFVADDINAIILHVKELRKFICKFDSILSLCKTYQRTSESIAAVFLLEKLKDEILKFYSETYDTNNILRVFDDNEKNNTSPNKLEINREKPEVSPDELLWY